MLPTGQLRINNWFVFHYESPCLEGMKIEREQLINLSSASARMPVGQALLNHNFDHSTIIHMKIGGIPICLCLHIVLDLCLRGVVSAYREWYPHQRVTVHTCVTQECPWGKQTSQEKVLWRESILGLVKQFLLVSSSEIYVGSSTS